MKMDLADIYYNLKHPAAYGGVNKLWQAAKQHGFSRKQVQEWLQSQDTYSLHKPKRKRFRRVKTITKGLNDLWQVDLADMANIARSNDGIKYLLVVIDVLSKYLRVVPLKTKHAQQVHDAMKQAFDEIKPKHIFSDRGTEFTNTKFKQLCQESGVICYTAQNVETKAAVAERCIRTLKGKIYKYLTKHNTRRYIEVLPDIVDNYNETKNRYGFRPIDVTRDNEADMLRILYPPKGHRNVTYKFKMGDSVRVSAAQFIFDKGYRPQWSQEVFTVNRRIPSDPPRYKVRDYGKEEILGTWYEQELQKVRVGDTYKVDKILRRRVDRMGKRQYFVKWLGYPAKFNSWVAEENIKRV